MEIKGKVLYVCDDFYLFSLGLVIYKRPLSSIEPATIFISLPVCRLKKVLSKNHLLERLFRLAVHHVLADEVDGYYIIFDKFICRVDSAGEVVGKVLRIRGSRPLCVCVKNCELYYGEYHNNHKRQPMTLYRYNGSLDFSVEKFFGVRHLHGVFSDPFSDDIYVTTGDHFQEAAIWRIRQSVKTPIIIGGQQSRAVQLLFTKDFIYFGTDTPAESNYIYKLNRETNVREMICGVSSSVFYGVALSKALYFSTVVEPSDHNLTRRVELWSICDDVPLMMGVYVKDYWSMRYFQYGQLIFPSYSKEYTQDDLWFYKQGVLNSGYSVRLTYD